MSLVGITTPPSAENAALRLHPADTVAIAMTRLAPGQLIRPGGEAVTVQDVVPVGHKVAIRRIAQGEFVLRYGEPIGAASAPIEPGQHVHTHNLAFEERVCEYEFPALERALPPVAGNLPVFLGYQRPDGRVGTRNYIAVVAASNCAAHTVQAIAESYAFAKLPPNVDGVVPFPHGEGCAHSIGADTEQLHRTLAGVLDHPNVSSAVIVGLGCETNQIADYLGSAEPGGRLAGLTLQQAGGTRATVETARREIGALLERAAAETRTEAPATKLVVGLNCGGSDSFSGITANPALGQASDLLAEIGATAILAETPEIVGAEHLLVRRARSRAVAERLLEVIANYRTYLNRFGGSFDDNPSPGNKAGGLTNIVEKSLGAVAKGGSSALNEVVDYAARVHGPGLVFMNTPGYDPVSLAGLAAGGANLIAFTTGRGSAIGFPTVPVLKIATNSRIYHQMRDNMDVNAGRIADGEATVEEVGREILGKLLRIASGERSASERLGHREFVPWRIGPVL
jgi:altronate hydrolase